MRSGAGGDDAKRPATGSGADAKPVFLSREERARLALQRRAERVAVAKQREQEVRRDREAFERDAAASRHYDRYHERQRSYRNKDRERERDESARSSSSNPAQPAVPLAASDLADIRRHYLGERDPRASRKRVRPGERGKVVFDWNASEDTEIGAEHNPIYAGHRATTALGFGRGRLGGIDEREQERAVRDTPYAQRQPMQPDQLAAAQDIVAGPVPVARRPAAASSASTSTTGASSGRSRRVMDEQLSHWSQKTLAQMRERDWRIFREDHRIATKGGAIPHPSRSWDEMGLVPEIKATVDFLGYTKPTPIQMQSIPIGLSGRDVMGIAQTGSGKTAAFVIPMLQYIGKLPKLDLKSMLDGPYALILAPTRELAQQIHTETCKFTAAFGFNVVTVVGGASKQEQDYALRKPCEILIATPGRLIEFLDEFRIVLNQCTYLVLDEADHMIELQFEPQVNRILESMPSEGWKSLDEAEAARQEASSATQAASVRDMRRLTMMYSATMPPGVERLSRKYLRRPATVIIGERGSAARTIAQEVVMVKELAKMHMLGDVLENAQAPIIVFCNSKRTCDVVARRLSGIGWSCVPLHGGKQQDQREAALQQFRDGHVDVLVATDVAARGIDAIVNLVVNFDMPPAPNAIQQYTHRIGRTGRAGREGRSVSFVTPDDTHVMYDLVRAMKEAGNSVPPELANHEAARVPPNTLGGGGGGGGGGARRGVLLTSS